MEYRVTGYNRTKEEPNSDTELFDSDWGCWGGIEGTQISSDYAINQIDYYVNADRHLNTHFCHYTDTKHTLIPSNYLEEATKAVFGDYVEYEVDDGRITLKNLHSLDKAYIMNGLFALRCYFEYEGFPSIMEIFKSLNATLRDVIYMAPMFYVRADLKTKEPMVYRLDYSGTPLKAHASVDSYKMARTVQPPMDIEKPFSVGGGYNYPDGDSHYDDDYGDWTDYEPYVQTMYYKSGYNAFSVMYRSESEFIKALSVILN